MRSPAPASLSRHRPRAPYLALLLATSALTAPGLITPAAAQNLPTGGSVAAGSASVSQTSPTSLGITQSSQSAVVNWQSFSIGQGYSVNIVQPNSSSALLNRVTGNTPSSIAGSLTANGQVYLVNPNGIAITSTGTVNVGGGFVASTLGISDADFMSGKRSFTGNGASAPVTNAGTITVGRGGYAALIGGTVSNSGNIYVPLGKVGLGSGEQATLDFSGDGFLQVAVPTNATTSGALIDNSGTIKADGGAVIMQAATAREAARNAINISGVVQARSIGGKTGAIEIGGGEGGQVTVSGKLTTASRKAKGGNITVTGKDIALRGAQLDASGKTGGGNVKVGGDRQGGGTLQHADTVTMDAASSIKADATDSGNGGNVVVWSDVQTNFAGTISARGGVDGGNGGEAEVSSHGLLNYGGLTDLSAPKGSLGTLLLDPYNVLITNAADAGQGTTTAGGTTTFAPTGTSVINVTTLQNALSTANVTITTGAFGSAGTDAGDITVASAVTWSSANSLTLSAYRNINVNAAITNTNGANVNLRADNSGQGSGTVSFGAGIQVSTAGTVSVYYNPTSNPATGTPTVNATSYTTATDYSGNIAGGGSITGYMLVNNVYDLQNVRNNLSGNYALGRDIDASVTSTWNSGAGLLPIGNLTFSNYNISGSYFSGIFDGQNQAISNLTINRASTSLVGLFSGNAGTIRNLGVTSGAITGSIYVGGLVGQNYGTITNSFSNATVSGYRYSGGLVGYNAGGVVRSSYATGNVTNTLRGQGSGGDGVGGLVGYNGASIVGSYASGAVSGEGGPAGGLVGNNNGSILQSYATGNVFGYTAGGLVGANSGPVTQAYSTGAVSATYSPYSGGLIGYDVSSNASVTNSYWDTQTSGYSNGIGSAAGTFQATGLTTVQFANSANMPGLTFGTTPGAAGYVIIDADGTFNNTSGANGATRPFLLTEYSTSIANAHQLQLMSLAPSASYTLMRNIDLSAALGSSSGNWFTSSSMLADGYGLVPIGSANQFRGVFDGGGHTISNLSISRGDVVGLFGYIEAGGTVKNLGVVNATVRGGNGGGNQVGVIAAQNLGTITNVYSTGAVFGTQNVGGLVGTNANIISQSYSTASVNGTGSNVGGLAGSNFGTISQSFAGGQVIGWTNVGGLVGISQAGATISDAYATGAVYGIANGSAIGGLVGYNQGTITRTYATGLVTASSNVGGLVGTNGPVGSVTSSFWDRTTTGRSQGYGSNSNTFNATGLTTAQLQDLSTYQATFGGWDFQGVWAPPNQVGQNNGSSSAHYPELYAFLTVLTIAPNAVTRFYGDTNPTLTATYYGNLKPGDSFATLASLFTSAGQFSNVGDYAITASGVVVNNVSGNTYRLVYIPGTLTVNGRPLTVTADAKTRVYGDTTDPTLTYQITGGSLLNGDLLTGNLTTLASSTTGVGGYLINQGTLGNSNYAITYVGANETITARPITVTANAQSRAYGDSNPTFTYTVGGSGLVNGDSLSGSLATSATGTSGVGSYGITQGDLGNSNYQITGYTSANLQITPRQVTVTADATSRYYGDSNPTLTYSVGGAGLVNGDSFSGSLATSAAATSSVGAYGITQGTLLNSNYTITSYTGANLSVTPRPITVTANAQSKVYGNSDPTLSYTVGGNGLVNGDTLSGLLTRAAGENVVPGGYAIGQGSVTSVNNPNYAITYNGNTLTITPATLTVAPNGGQSKTYGNADPTFGYTASGQVVNSALGIDDSGLSLTGALGRAAGETVAGGPYGYTLNTLSAGANYTLVMAASPSSFAITPATLTVTPNSGQSKTYGNADPTFGYTASGQVVNSALGIDDSGLSLTGALGRAAGETVAGGPYGYTLNSLSAGSNYTLVMATNPSSFAITPATLTYTANTATRQYGDANPAMFGTVTGYVNGESAATALSGTMTFGSSATGTSGIGNYDITGSGLTANNGNYTFVQAAANATALSITPRTITVTADAQSKVYGSADPTFTYAVGGNGLVNGDTLSGALGRTAGENVIAGGYAITQGGVTNTNNPNYAISYTGNTLTITPATLTYIANTATRQYGDTNPSLSGTVGGYVNGDTQMTATTGTLTFTTGATGTSGIGGYDITGSGLATNANYVFAQAAGNATALAITPRIITVTADWKSRAYGEANPALTYQVGGAGLVNGDTLTGALSTSADGVSGVGTYGIAQHTLAASSNYALTYVGAGLSVTPRAITVTADAQTRFYGEANPNLTYQVGGMGLVNGDTLLGSLMTSATASTGIGTYAITQGSLGVPGNYTLTYTGANLSVTPRPITVTADARTKVYGAADPALTYTVGGNGLVNGDTLSGALGRTTGENVIAGGYAITQGGVTNTNNPNYAISYTGNTLTVTPATLTYIANTATRQYGDANPTLSGSVSGYVNGDTQMTATTGTLTFTTGATGTSGIGGYDITGSGLTTNANYVFAQAAGNATALTIIPRAITVTADAQNRTYGDANPTLTYAVGGGGMVNGDTLSGGLASSATATSNIGNYAITQGSLAASSNYTLTSYTGATLTVTPRSIAVTADAQSRIYGDANPTFSYTVGGMGLVNGDTLSGSLASAATGTSNVGGYAITQGSLTASSNYTLSTFTGSTLTVTARPLTVTADAKTKFSGDANPALTYAIGGQGLVNGDTLAGALATSADTNSPAGSYAITQGTVSASANYLLTYAGNSLTVQPRATSNSYSAILDQVLANNTSPIALPVGATAIQGAPQIATANGLATFYADPRSDRALVCFGSMCFAAF